MESLLALEMMALTSVYCVTSCTTYLKSSGLPNWHLWPETLSGFKHQRIFSLWSHMGETTNAIICWWKHHLQLQRWLKACLGSGRAWVQWARVLQSLFPMSIGCSDHLNRLEGTVHSAFEAWTSLKKQKWSYRGRKGWSKSEGDCANSSAWVGRGKWKLLVTAPRHAFFVYSGAEAMYFSQRTVRLAEEVGKKLVFTHDSHTMIHPVPHYRQQPWPILCNPTTFPDFRGTQLFVLSYSRMAWFLLQRNPHKRALTESCQPCWSFHSFYSLTVTGFSLGSKW